MKWGNSKGNSLTGQDNSQKKIPHTKERCAILFSDRI
jgi:hypothetical protein